MLRHPAIHPLPTLAIFVIALLAGCARPRETKIVRDDFGVPHIFSPTDEGVCFGLGYAQAEDRLDEMMKNYRRAEGTMAEAFGQRYFEDDLISRISQHAETSRKMYDTLRPKTRRLIEAYIAGVKAYMTEHPGEVPQWAVDPQPWHSVALSRHIISGWPVGDAQDDLERVGLKIGDLPYLGSNEWIVGPSNSASGKVIALIDPHLSWYDEFRFHECRLYGKDLVCSGFGIVGSFIPTLGHSRYCSIAMTTGSGDTADIFEETVNPKNPRQYEYDGKWRDMTFLPVKIGIKQEDGKVVTKEVPLEYTHHGPVVARKEGKAYAMANPYLNSIGLGEQTYDMMTARNLKEMKQAIARLELMGQNVMIGTVDGDIYYQRTGKVPVRAEGVDPSRPIPGNTSTTEWKGFHKPEELVQIENPPQGYMQNCNTSPVNMMENSPLRLQNYRSYIYGIGEDPPDQRAASVLHLLKGTRQKKMTVEEAREIAMSTFVLGADLWIGKLKNAWAAQKAEVSASDDIKKMYAQISAWDQHSHAESTGAMTYRYWKMAIPEEARKNDKLGGGPPESLSDAAAIEALKTGAARMKAELGSVEVPFGRVFRVGRRGSDKSWPVGGGTRGGELDNIGMGTPRAIGFFEKGPDGTLIGERGQTSTQIVELTRPPRSWTVMPTGESDHKESGHWDDQAEKLYSLGKMKPTYFMDPKGLKGVTKSVKVLKY